MSASVQWAGLEELKAALRNLPAELTGEASHIVEATANGAIVDMRAQYPPGELRDKLSQTTLASGRFGTGIQIRNSSGWAWAWEHGTQARHWRNGKSTGQIPRHDTFVGVMAPARRRMLQALAQMLERQGLRVTGDA